MKAIVTGTVIVAALVATLAIAANRPAGTAEIYPADCLTSGDVVRYAERSRNGVSLSCNEEARLRNLQREALR